MILSLAACMCGKALLLSILIIFEIDIDFFRKMDYYSI